VGKLVVLKDVDKNKSFLKAMLVLPLGALLISGVYFAAKRYNLSSKLAFFACALFSLLLITLFLIGLWVKQKDGQRKYIAKMLIISSIGVIALNLILLYSPYFSPHKTTTNYNRYYSKALDYTYWLDNYTQDKTVFMTDDNHYFSEEKSGYTPIDHSNLLSFFSSAKNIAFLDNAESFISQKQRKYLYEQKGKFESITQEYDMNKNAFFYTGFDPCDYDSIVFLQDKNYDVYFMPYEIYEQIKDLG
jgi:hypothetical protein